MPQNKADRSNGNNCGGTSLVSHAGKVMPKIVANRLSDGCEEQCDFRSQRSTVGVRFVVRWLQELRRQSISLCMCLVDSQKAYDSVDRKLREGNWPEPAYWTRLSILPAESTTA